MSQSIEDPFISMNVERPGSYFGEPTDSEDSPEPHFDQSPPPEEALPMTSQLPHGTTKTPKKPSLSQQVAQNEAQNLNSLYTKFTHYLKGPLYDDEGTLSAQGESSTLDPSKSMSKLTKARAENGAPFGDASDDTMSYQSMDDTGTRSRDQNDALVDKALGKLRASREGDGGGDVVPTKRKQPLDDDDDDEQEGATLRMSVRRRTPSRRAEEEARETASSNSGHLAPARRRRPDSDPTRKPPDPVKQKAGTIGQRVKQARAIAQADELFDDDPESPAPKREGTESSATMEGVEDGRLVRLPKRRIAKADHAEMVVSTSAQVPIDETEFIDGEGRKFRIAHGNVTTQDRDSLWERLSKQVAELRLNLEPETFNSPLSKAELSTIDLRSAATLLPALVNSDARLRVRRQQDSHRAIKGKAISAFLRRVERSAHDTLTILGHDAKSLPPEISQPEALTRLLQLPKQERTISLAEHNSMIEGHEEYLGIVAEKLRIDLAFIHTAVERFTEAAARHENRLASLCVSLQDMALRSEESPTLPLLAIEYAMPGSHRCQCKDCSERYADINQREQDELAKAGLEVDQLWEEFNRQTHERVVRHSDAFFAPAPRYQSHFRGYRREEVMEGYNACDPPTRWYDPEDPDSICSVIRALDAWKEPFYDLKQGPETLDTRLGEGYGTSDMVLAEQTSILIAQREGEWQRILGSSMDAEGEPTQAWIAQLDSLRQEGQRALATRAVYQDAEEEALEARLDAMRADYARMLAAIPKLPEQGEPGYPPSEELKQEVSRLHHDVEAYRLRICQEVDARWQQGYRKELGDAERVKTEEWNSLMGTRQLGWPEDELTEAEENRQRASEDRQAWEDRVTKEENRNRERIERLLRTENVRRVNLRPTDPEARESVGAAKVEVPRALIELTEQQMSSLGTEPPRSASLEEAQAIHRERDSWRERYLSSRREMDKDPVAWITQKRASFLPTQPNFPGWAERSGYYQWAAEVQSKRLDAVASFVLWEQTVGAHQANMEYEQALKLFELNRRQGQSGEAFDEEIMTATNEEDSWGDNSNSKDTKSVDITQESAKPDPKVIEAALLVYVTKMDSRLSEEEKGMWKTRFLQPRWWRTWGIGSEGTLD